MVNMNKKIIIVGHGFVGKALDYGFSHPHVDRVCCKKLICAWWKTRHTSEKFVVDWNGRQIAIDNHGERLMGRYN